MNPGGLRKISTGLAPFLRFPSRQPSRFGAYACLAYPTSPSTNNYYLLSFDRVLHSPISPSRCSPPAIPVSSTTPRFPLHSLFAPLPLSSPPLPAVFLPLFFLPHLSCLPSSFLLAELVRHPLPAEAVEGCATTRK